MLLTCVRRMTISLPSMSTSFRDRWSFVDGPLRGYRPGTGSSSPGGGRPQALFRIPVGMMPPCWFRLSNRQGSCPFPKSLWVPPLPFDTTGDKDRCNPRPVFSQESTFWFPCAASSL